MLCLHLKKRMARMLVFSLVFMMRHLFFLSVSVSGSADAFTEPTHDTLGQRGGGLTPSRSLQA